MTDNIGLLLDREHDLILLVVEIACLLVILILTLWVLLLMRATDQTWDHWAAIRFKAQA